MKGIIKDIENYVKSQADEEDWRYHISLVVKYAKYLAKKYKANLELIELAALLHDIGRLPYIDKADINHNISGAKKAEKILHDFNYPKEKINMIKKAILSHRSNKLYIPKTMLEKIIANADAMAHFDVLPVFYFWRGKRGFNFHEITEWVEAKLKKDWQKKITLPEARDLVKEKYETNKKILSYLRNINAD